MAILCRESSLSEIGHRLRWIVSAQLEHMFSSLFADVQVLPFGSSVNGIGREGCDLDVVVCVGEDPDDQFAPSADLAVGGCPFMFHNKANGGGGDVDDARRIRKRLAVFADMLQTFGPGCTQVRSVLICI